MKRTVVPTNLDRSKVNVLHEHPSTPRDGVHKRSWLVPKLPWNVGADVRAQQRLAIDLVGKGGRGDCARHACMVSSRD